MCAYAFNASDNIAIIPFATVGDEVIKVIVSDTAYDEEESVDRIVNAREMALQFNAGDAFTCSNRLLEQLTPISFTGDLSWIEGRKTLVR